MLSWTVVRSICATIIGALVLVVSVGCDEPTSRLGLLQSGDGSIVVLYKPCDPKTTVVSVLLIDDEQGDSLWEIASVGVVLQEYTIGETPVGFVEVTPFADTDELPDKRLRIRVRSTSATNSETFEPGDLRTDRVYVPRAGYLAEEEFFLRDTCD